MFLSDHPTKSGDRQEGTFLHEHCRANIPWVPKGRCLWKVPASHLLPQLAAGPAPALFLWRVFPLLQDRRRALHQPGSVWQVSHQDRNVGEWGGRTRGRNQNLEFWCQLLGVLRTKQRVCQQKAETDSMRAQMRSSWKLQPHEHLHEYRIKMILLLKMTASEKLGCEWQQKATEREMPCLGESRSICSAKHGRGGGCRSELFYCGWSQRLEAHLRTSSVPRAGWRAGYVSARLTPPGSTPFAALGTDSWSSCSTRLLLDGVQIQILCNCTQDQVTEVTTEMNKSKCLCLQRGKKVNPPTKTLNDLQMENVPFIFYLCRQIAQYELSFCQGQWWPVHGNPWQLWNKWIESASTEGMCSHGKWPMGKNKNYLNLSCLEELSGDIISSRDWEIHFLSPPLQSFHCINGIC